MFDLTCLRSTPNYIYGGSGNCCFTVDCAIDLPQISALGTLTAIEINPAFNTCSWSIIEVNGVPVSTTNPLPTPITWINQTNLSVKIVVCPCVGITPPTNTFDLQYALYYTVGTTSYTIPVYVPLTEIDPNDLSFEPLPVSVYTTGVDVFPCIGTSGCSNQIAGTVPITNYTNFELPLAINDYLTLIPPGTVFYINGVQQTGTTLIIPPLSTVDLGFGFCWPNSTPGVVDFLLDCCDIYSQRVILNVSPVICYGCGIACSGFDIKTENTYLPDYSGCGLALPNIYDKASVGEKKTIEWTYVYPNGFPANSNVDVYFNPHLYTAVQVLNVSDPYSLPIPDAGWYLKIQGWMVGSSVAYNMYQVTSPAYVPSQQNWEVTLEVLNANEFKISFTFYVTMDIQDKITNDYIENWKRFYVQIPALSTPINSIVPNVYNSSVSNPKFIGNELFIIDNNVQDPTQNIITRAYRCFIYNPIPFKAAWYNPAPYQPAVDYYFELFDPTSMVIKSPQEFSIFDKTYVRFEFPMLTANAPTAVVVYIFTSEDFDDTIDFLSNNQVSRAEITTIVPASILGGVIESPSVGPTLVVPGYYYVEFTVGTGFDASKKYNIAGIVYDDVGNQVNTWMYKDIAISSTPSVNSLCCPLSVSEDWSDYNNVYPGANVFQATVKQRIKHTVRVEGGLFDANCLFATFGWVGDWTKLVTQVEINVYRRQSINQFVNDHDVYFMYYRNIATRNTASQFGFNYSNPDLNSLFACYIVNPGEITIEWIGRVRWEDFLSFPANNVLIAHEDTQYNRFNPSIFDANFYINHFEVTYDWASPFIGGPQPYPYTGSFGPGRVFFEYIISIDMQPVLGIPFTIKKVIRRSVHIYREEPMLPNFNTPLNVLLDPLVLEGWDGTNYVSINGPICVGQYEHIKVTMTAPAGDTGVVIPIINRPPFSINSIAEDDSGVIGSPGGITQQLNTQYIYDVTSGPASGLWEFKVRTDQLPIGNYEICSLYLQ